MSDVYYLHFNSDSVKCKFVNKIILSPEETSGLATQSVDKRANGSMQVYDLMADHISGKKKYEHFNFLNGHDKNNFILCTHTATQPTALTRIPDCNCSSRI